jgi:hypothetical protein
MAVPAIEQASLVVTIINRERSQSESGVISSIDATKVKDRGNATDDHVTGHLMQQNLTKHETHASSLDLDFSPALLRFGEATSLTGSCCLRTCPLQPSPSTRSRQLTHSNEISIPMIYPRRDDALRTRRALDVKEFICERTLPNTVACLNQNRNSINPR